MRPDQRFGQLLKRVHQLWHQVINERLRPRGVSHSQWRVVLEVSRSGAPLTQSALAAELGVESPTMVRLLDRLEDKGWIERTPCPTDRRARYVELTPRARRLASEIEVVVGEVRRALLRDLQPDELANCISALSRVESRAVEALASTSSPASRKRGSTTRTPPSARSPRADAIPVARATARSSRESGRRVRGATRDASP
jgi:MarR family transcriptional regulator for hemolysin